MVIYVELQHQLECISPPVGMPTTCTVTRMGYLLVPSTHVYSPAGF